MGKKNESQASKNMQEKFYGRISLMDGSLVSKIPTWSIRAVPGQILSQYTKNTPPASVIQEEVEKLCIKVKNIDRPIGLSCSSCEIEAFESLEEQYTHFKSEWHVINLKRRAKGASSLTEEEVRQKMEDKDKSHESDASESASSSSEMEEEDEEFVVTTTEPVIEYTDGKSVFKVYKNLLPDFDKEDFEPYSSLNQLTQKRFKWAVFLLRSGRFAGAIFEKEKAICHKTFQRYTTRRKQGGSQSAHDKSGGKAKSAGATLRRYNEAALKEDIVELLEQWKDQLLDVELIFLSSGKNDRGHFFGGKKPIITAEDERLKRIPFATNRPTFEEVCRVHFELSTIRFLPLSEVKSPKGKKSPSKQKQKTPSTTIHKPIELQEEVGKQKQNHKKIEDTRTKEELQFCEAVKENNLDQVEKLIQQDGVDINSVDYDLMSPLHYAAEKDSVQMITFLLNNGSNPTLLDLHMRPPYFLCSTKEARNAFRKYMGDHPDQWDYTTSQIPSALTDDMKQKRKEKEAEKRKRAKERKKQQKIEAAEQERVEEQKKEEEAKKIAAGMACDSCGKFAGNKPFTRLEFKYCSTDCVNNHRRHLTADAALRRLGGQ